jgi:hypothetical protein
MQGERIAAYGEYMCTWRFLETTSAMVAMDDAF